MTVDPVVFLNRLKEQQSIRAKTYAKLESGFEDFLQSERVDCQQLFSGCTEQFQLCSKNIRDLEDAFRKSGHLTYADLIRSLQEKEREKLELTIKFQRLSMACRQPSDEAFSEAVRAAAMTSLRTELSHLRVEINEVLDEVQIELSDLLNAE
eukprot:NODE_1860_length_730_cov_211.885463_g1449_i0.p1 GENE.NODE_1860_length_730_cov_211.885463_g1449_i0~~NODE_1860_length_730_cov_211.885463_g1449_i0.p1  ORF type:complete len:152 (-),score=39.13 NODE_1860_length_730_cov_211.885463_g1449_i0:209-664(-)